MIAFHLMQVNPFHSKSHYTTKHFPSKYSIQFWIPIYVNRIQNDCIPLVASEIQYMQVNPTHSKSHYTIIHFPSLYSIQLNSYQCKSHSKWFHSNCCKWILFIQSPIKPKNIFHHSIPFSWIPIYVTPIQNDFIPLVASESYS